MRLSTNTKSKSYTLWSTRRIHICHYLIIYDMIICVNKTGFRGAVFSDLRFAIANHWIQTYTGSGTHALLFITSAATQQAHQPTIEILILVIAKFRTIIQTSLIGTVNLLPLKLEVCCTCDSMIVDLIPFADYSLEYRSMWQRMQMPNGCGCCFRYQDLRCLRTAYTVHLSIHTHALLRRSQVATTDTVCRTAQTIVSII